MSTMQKGHTVAVVFLLMLIFAPPSNCSYQNILKFLHVSDIHLDPFYDKSIDKTTRCHAAGSTSNADYEAPYGRIGCDSPTDLLELTLSAMREKGDNAKFIILTGIKIGLFCKCKNQRFHLVLQRLIFIFNKSPPPPLTCCRNRNAQITFLTRLMKMSSL